MILRGKMIAQHYLSMLFDEFRFFCFAAVLTWLKHTYAAKS